jgi:hypothetical protein
MILCHTENRRNHEFERGTCPNEKEARYSEPEAGGPDQLPKKKSIQAGFISTGLPVVFSPRFIVVYQNYVDVGFWGGQDMPPHAEQEVRICYSRSG